MAQTQKYMGKGVLKACENVNTEIADELIGLGPFNQAMIDEAMKNSMEQTTMDA